MRTSAVDNRKKNEREEKRTRVIILRRKKNFKNKETSNQKSFFLSVLEGEKLLNGAL